jgi:hypothetical protein
MLTFSYQNNGKYGLSQKNISAFTTDIISMSLLKRILWNTHHTSYRDHKYSQIMSSNPYARVYQHLIQLHHWININPQHINRRVLAFLLYGLRNARTWRDVHCIVLASASTVINVRGGVTEFNRITGIRGKGYTISVLV